MSESVKVDEQIINVAVDRELWKEVGVIAVTKGITRREALDRALREYCKGYKGGAN